jgi:lauroyl/myristoyl acyltransferase
VDFLNGKASFLPGAITLAKLTGAPVLIMLLHRSPDWRHQVLEISLPVSVDGDTQVALRRCLAVIEEAIRRNPAHWIYWRVPYLIRYGLISKEQAKAHRMAKKK